MSQRQPHGSNDPGGGSENELQWSYIATAPDQLIAEMWQELLAEASIPSMLAPEDTVSFLGIASTPVRLMVPRDLQARAREALARALEGGELPGDPDQGAS